MVAPTPVPVPWYRKLGAEALAFLKGETYVHGWLLVVVAVGSFILGRLI